MLTIYEPGINSDLLVLSWWHHMATSGALEQTFSASMAPCSAFMSEMRRCALVYEADVEGFWFTAWYDVALAGAYHHAWIRADRRASKSALRAMIESLHFGLERWPVLISVTKQPKVVEQINRLGFVTLGDIPSIFDGEAATLSWLDSEHFYPTVAKYGRLFDSPSLEAANGR